MQGGIELEPAARAAYEDFTGIIMQAVVMVSGEYSASLDGLSLPGDTILEVKCPMKGQDSETWKPAETGQIERHYQLQIQQLVVRSGSGHSLNHIVRESVLRCGQVSPHEGQQLPHPLAGVFRLNEPCLHPGKLIANLGVVNGLEDRYFF